MEFIKNKKILFPVLFSIIHVILTIIFLVLSFGSVMTHFENPNDEFLGLRSKIYDFIFNVLSFPTVFIFWRVTNPGVVRLSQMAGPLSFFLPIFINSSLWGVGFYSLCKFISRFRSK